MRAATSLLDGDAAREENLFVPPPVFKVRNDEMPRTTKILPPTDAMPIANPFPPQGHSWRRAFFAGGLLGGLVVGAISFHAEVGRFVTSRLHKTAAPPSAIAVPAPTPPPAVAAPVPTATPPAPPATPPPAAPVVEEHAPPPAAAAAVEPIQPVEEPAAVAASAQRKPAIAGDRRAPIRSTRLAGRPAATARRKASPGRSAATGSDTDEAPAPGKGDNWVDPFSDGTWTKLPSDQ